VTVDGRDLAQLNVEDFSDTLLTALMVIDTLPNYHVLNISR